MFKDEYTKEMNEISPAENLKLSIIKDLERGGEDAQSKTKQRKSCNMWRLSFAVCAIAAIVLSVLFVPKSTQKAPFVPSTNTTALNTASYDEIYNLISKHQYETPIDVYAKYGIATDDMMDMGGVPEAAVGTSAESNASSDSAAKPSVNSPSNQDDNDYSETNTQVEGVAEADLVRTDGKYIYALFDGKIGIISAKEGNLQRISTIDLEILKEEYCNDFYLTGNYIVAISQSRSNYFYTYDANGQPNVKDSYARVIIIDISDPASPKKVTETKQSGSYTDSRLIGNHLYLVSEHRIVNRVIDKNNPQDYVPYVTQDGNSCVIPADCIRICNIEQFNPIYTVVAAYDIKDGKMLSVQSVLGSSSLIYCSNSNLLAAFVTYDENGGNTVVSRFAIDNGKVEFKASATINGTLLNQFSMDEHSGNFRFVTTTETVTTTYYDDGGYSVSAPSNTACLYVLNENMEQIGALENVSDNERVYSVRFMGDTVYFVTFRQTDPLFSVDLSNPRSPKILSALKIPGFSNYLFPYGDGKLLGLGMDANEKTGRTTFLKLSMFDISDPSNVTENNKYILNNAQYSPALYNHKASLIDADKNLIGFFTDGYSYPNVSLNYVIFNFDDNGFNKLCEIPVTIKGNYENIRGLFINDYFYLVTYNTVTAYSLNDFTVISSVQF